MPQHERMNAATTAMMQMADFAIARVISRPETSWPGATPISSAQIWSIFSLDAGYGRQQRAYLAVEIIGLF
jgi:hypothetical protein